MNTISNAMQACTWTGDCELPGCANRCVVNLTPHSAFTALEDAAWRPTWYEACPRVAQVCHSLSLSFYLYLSLEATWYEACPRAAQVCSSLHPLVCLLLLSAPPWRAVCTCCSSCRHRDGSAGHCTAHRRGHL